MSKFETLHKLTMEKLPQVVRELSDSELEKLREECCTADRLLVAAQWYRPFCVLLHDYADSEHDRRAGNGVKS